MLFIYVSYKIKVKMGEMVFYPKWNLILPIWPQEMK